MITKIAHLPESEQKHFYKQLTTRLLEVFAFDYYEDDKDLQQDFHEWKNSDRKDYHDILNEILTDISPEGIELNWRDLGKLNYRRWHVCAVCDKPFIDYGTNKQKTCYTIPYQQYKVGTEEQQGSYRKATEKGYSECNMAYRAIKMAQWRQSKKVS